VNSTTRKSVLPQLTDALQIGARRLAHHRTGSTQPVAARRPTRADHRPLLIPSTLDNGFAERGTGEKLTLGRLCGVGSPCPRS
jgi:hypothetical protein